MENDQEWYAKIASVAPANCKILFRTDLESYLGALAEQQRTFDIILVDGALNRRRMAEEALKWISKGGFILLDNSDCHVNAAQVLRIADLIQVDFCGFAPAVWHEQTTALDFLSEIFECNQMGHISRARALEV